MTTTTLQPPPTFELRDISNMDRIINLFRTRPEYEPLQTGAERDDEDLHDGSEDGAEGGAVEQSFSRVEYTIFLLLGIAMLWAW